MTEIDPIRSEGSPRDAVPESGSAPVLVTGATRGVGRATTELLQARGGAVLGVYRSSIEAGRELSLLDGVAMIQADLSTNTGIDQVANFCGEGSLSGAVLNAGISITTDFSDTGDGDGDPLTRQLHDDLTAPLLLLRALLAQRVFAPRASIVFVTSNLARRAVPGHVAYAAAKAGLEAATRHLAAELGGQGLRVNAVAPGLLRTDMTAHMGEAGYLDYEPEVPLGRVGTADDVARALAFFLGDDSSYVSGQVLDVDGGWGV